MANHIGESRTLLDLLIDEINHFVYEKKKEKKSSRQEQGLSFQVKHILRLTLLQQQI